MGSASMIDLLLTDVHYRWSSVILKLGQMPRHADPCDVEAVEWILLQLQPNFCFLSRFIPEALNGFKTGEFSHWR